MPVTQVAAMTMPAPKIRPPTRFACQAQGATQGAIQPRGDHALDEGYGDQERQQIGSRQVKLARAPDEAPQGAVKAEIAPFEEIAEHCTGGKGQQDSHTKIFRFRLSDVGSGRGRPTEN